MTRLSLLIFSGIVLAYWLRRKPRPEVWHGWRGSRACGFGMTTMEVAADLAVAIWLGTR